MTNKFKYPIFPDRVYTLTYDDMSIEVSGEEILNMFYRRAMMNKLISDWTDDPNTPELSTDL